MGFYSAAMAQRDRLSKISKISSFDSGQFVLTVGTKYISALIVIHHSVAIIATLYGNSNMTATDASYSKIIGLN